jgi:ribose transport system permease protein
MASEIASQAPSQSSGEFGKLRGKIINREFLPLLILVLLSLTFSIMQPAFLSYYNFLTIITQAATLLILTISMTMIILMGRIDLSTGGVISFTSVSVALLFPVAGLGGFFLGILIGLGFGLVNGLCHQYMRIPSFISTFGVGGIALGLAYTICGGQPIAVPQEFAPIRNLIIGDSIDQLGNIHFIALFMTIVGYFILRHTAFGRYVYSLGYQEKVSHMSGVPIKKTVISGFAFHGLCCGLVGALLTCRLAIGGPQVGDPFTLQAIATVLVGGTAISGGSGSIARSLVGCAIITVLLNGMNIAAVNPYARQVVLGVAIVLVVAFTLDRSKISVVK